MFLCFVCNCVTSLVGSALSVQGLLPLHVCCPRASSRTEGHTCVHTGTPVTRWLHAQQEMLKLPSLGWHSAVSLRVNCATHFFRLFERGNYTEG